MSAKRFKDINYAISRTSLKETSLKYFLFTDSIFK